MASTQTNSVETNPALRSTHHNTQIVSSSAPTPKKSTSDATMLLYGASIVILLAVVVIYMISKKPKHRSHQVAQAKPVVKSKSIKYKFDKHKYKAGIVVALLFAIVGTYELFTTHAATPVASLEAESGTRAGTSAIESSSNASAGSYVQLGTPIVTTPIGGTPAAVIGAYSGPGNTSGVDAVGTLLGHHLNYAMDFLSGTSWSTITQATYPYSSWVGKGYTMVWGVDMLTGDFSPNSNPSVAGGSAYGLTQGASGAYNAYFKTVAQNIVNEGFGNSIIRLGWEFNGGWFPWAANGASGAFVQYWQNIVNTMRSVPGQNFKFEWNPTLGDLSVGDLANYYPGDSYVDIIGEDVYDVAWSNYPGCQAEWQTMLNENYGLNWFASFANQHNKQMSFPEWGLGFGTEAQNCGTLSNTNTQVGGGDDNYFVQQMAAYIAAHNFSNAVVWDYGNPPLPDASQSPNATAAFVTGFK